MATRTSTNNDNTGRLYTYDHQSPAYAATIALAPNASETLVTPGQLTGNLTINVTETNCQIGDKLIILFTTDGTQRTVTYGTNMKSAGTQASNVNDPMSATFIYDGTDFVEVARATTN